jgi:predicted NAD/FAD-dependent oxidoreductase
MNGADRLKPNKLVHNLGKMYVCKLEFGIAGEWRTLIIQTNWEWSIENLEQDCTVVGEMLHHEAEQLLGMNLRDLMYQAVHLWRYAAPRTVAFQPYFLDPVHHLAACGDWCVAGRVEGAFLSANALAKQMI